MDAAPLHLRAQARGQRAARDHRLADRGGVDAGGGGLVEQDLQEIGRAGIGGRLELLHGLQGLFGIAGTGGDHRAAQRHRAALHDEGARRQMVGEAVEHDVAAHEACGCEGGLRAEHVVAVILDLEDRPRRHEEPPETARRPRGDPREGRPILLRGREAGFAQQRQAREIGGRLQGGDIDAFELARQLGRLRAKFGQAGAEGGEVGHEYSRSVRPPLPLRGRGLG